MTKIIILDEFTKNQIAAGEVVERPLSVVKELAENSLDAGARRITVELNEGGLASITVTDDGCGMGEEDLALAFERHATSKITCASDLSRILTLGFRGEAIPSIAAVSRMDFTSRPADALNGARVEAVEGVIVNRASAGCPPGSTVVVRDLFFNTPVRKKSMKSPSVEGSLCGEVISHMALARPDVSFELRNKSRRSFYSPGTGDLIDTIIAVYGVSQAREMIPVDSTASGITLKGFIGKPSLSRSSKSHINIIINGRYVHCPAAAGAVEEAYRTLLPHGRKPVVVLSLAVPPELIDVNVHPSKLEVRLLEEKDIVRQVSRTLREVLLAKTVIPAKLFNPEKRSAGADLYQDLFAAPRGTLKKEEIDSGAAAIQGITEVYDNPVTINYDLKKAGEKAADYLSGEKALPEIMAVGQIGLTYILAEGKDGLYILDQHAAHERVLYEDYLAGEGERPSQGLLLPVTLELDYREAAVLTERIFWFNRAGFVLEYFGGNTFLIRGAPPGFAPGQEKEFFNDMLEYLRERGAGASYDEFFSRLASSLACKSAVKAGEKLAQSSMDALIDRLAGAENPYTCPHGRPTIIHLSFTDLEKKFKR
ncbi:DNA mismatch repair endonuclease MutL [Pelotomaculum propionicicum]|uniref:DNA mismatch repair endonuclease MutL n=1 Tax=Pelotomaculum propionicicum TaxID=258475 RepID=UPI003B7A7628